MKKRRKKGIAIIALSALLTATVLPVLHIPNQITVAATTQKGTTTKDLYVLTGPDGEKIVKNGAYLVAAEGTTVTIGGEKDSYYYVTFQYNGNGEEVKGWVPKSGIKVTVPATATPTAVPVKETTDIVVKNLSIPAKSTAASLRVRTSAGTDKPQLEIDGEKVVLTLNQKVRILKERVIGGKVWYYVKFKYTDSVSKKGYVLSDYIKLTLSSEVAAKMNCLSKIKIRKKAGIGSAYLKVSGKEVSLKNGKTVKIIGETVANSKKWYQIKFRYKDVIRKGYLLANAVVFKPAASTTSTATPVPTATVVPTMKPTAKPPVSTQKPVSTTPVSTTPEAVKTPVTTEVPTATPVTVEVKKGIVTTDYLNVRTGPGTDQDKLQYDEKNVQLMKGDVTTILDEKNVNGVSWYHVSFTYEGVILKGYIYSAYVEVKVESETVSTAEPEYTPLTESEFEAMMVAENFPESYKEALRVLHQKYPLWQFKANHTGLKWNTVINKESVLGINLISNNKSVAWKSLESGAYDWRTDTFIAYDGTSWVTPSKKALEYYVDPRNFLNPSSMFQFQVLSYNAEYQTVNGVENILKNTPMYQASYSYTETGKKVTCSYADTFIKAAEYSGVNPYHLATRVKQEVVTSKTTMSDSVSGTVSGYKGIYNFYNIGATHSTVAGGSIANGLNFAKNGTSSTANNTLFLIPWNRQDKAIIGGAKFIGNNYINKGQDTVYLQKFNVTDYSTYNHQYMANIEAPNSESIKTYNAYSDMKEIPVEFSIPVYEDMPDNPCEVPSGGANPNNWLKKLSVTGYTITPEFCISDDVKQEYTITVPDNVSIIKVNASSVSSLANVTGNGTVTLNEGSNVLEVKVTAENGDVRTYILHVEREK